MVNKHCQNMRLILWLTPCEFFILIGSTGVKYFLKVIGINTQMLMKNSISNTFKIIFSFTYSEIYK